MVRPSTAIMSTMLVKTTIQRQAYTTVQTYVTKNPQFIDGSRMIQFTCVNMRQHHCNRSHELDELVCQWRRGQLYGDRMSSCRCLDKGDKSIFRHVGLDVHPHHNDFSNMARKTIGKVNNYHDGEVIENQCQL